MLAIAASTSALGLSACRLGADDASADRERAVVLSVIDGDTIKVRRDGGEVADVRMIGIDTPESSALRYGEPDCGGERATTSMEALLERGARVSLIADPTQDRVDQHGRLLRYVEHEGVDVGAAQVKRGFAEAYVFDPSSPPTRSGIYHRAQGRAEAAQRGIYTACDGDFHSSE